MADCTEDAKRARKTGRRVETSLAQAPELSGSTMTRPRAAGPKSAVASESHPD